MSSAAALRLLRAATTARSSRLLLLRRTMMKPMATTTTVMMGPSQQLQHQQQQRLFGSAACALDEDLERERMYGGKPSPMTEFLDLAVHHGHTSIGPPPKYRLVEAPVLKCGISEDDLTFKTTSYGRLLDTPHVQHQEHKVTMCVRWHVLPLNDFEKRILMEIVGARYKPEHNELKLTSEQFGSRIENKRHLVSMLDRLVFAARKLAVEAQKQQDVEQAVVAEE
jgi:Mitochondrial ribosomal subunit protein